MTSLQITNLKNLTINFIQRYAEASFGNFFDYLYISS